MDSKEKVGWILYYGLFRLTAVFCSIQEFEVYTENLLLCAIAHSESRSEFLP